ARPMIERLSGDRVRHELNHILTSRFAPQIFARLDELELLKAIHPGLAWDDWLYARIEALPALDPGPEWELEGDRSLVRQQLGYLLLLINLPRETADGVAHRLKLPVELAEAVRQAGELWQERRSLVGLTPGQATRRLEDLAPLARCAVYLASSDAQLKGVLREYAMRWRHVHARVDGFALKRMGIPPGPAYRRILGELRRAWLDGELSTPEDEQAQLERLIQAEAAGQ
ncbi:MAG: hypothetical protein ACKOC5_02060, partial [Chloroflexota bacterium]